MKLLVLVFIAVLVHSNYGLSEQAVIRTAQLKSGNDTCQLCKGLVTDLKNIVNDASVQKDIVNFIVYYICPLVGKAKDECKQYVESYLPIAFSYLVSQLDPTMMCKEMGFCSAKNEIVESRLHQILLSGLLKAGHSKQATGDSSNSGKCVVCKLVMKYLDHILGQKRSEEAIKEALNEVCGYLPSLLKSECEDFVKQYTDQIVKLLIQGLDPKQICTEIGLCTSSINTERKVFVSNKEKSTNSILCVVCETAMKSLDELLGQNRSEEAIKEALDEVCGYLPSILQSECEGLVKQYTDQIVKLLIQGLDPKQICTEIGLCTNTERERKDNQSQNVQPNFIQCTLCEYVLEKLESILVDKRTKADIEKALDKVCDLLPTYIRTECTVFINQYTDNIIKYLIKGESPRIICTLIGLCTLSVEDKVPEENGSVLFMTRTGDADSKPCSICKEIVTLLDTWMKKPSTANHLQNDLKKLCGFLPQAYTKKCDSLVDMYGKVILQLLSQLVNPRKVCEYMYLCQNGNKALKYRPLPLLGKEKCSYGPAYWCANLENAKQCQSVNHCQKYVWIQ